MIDRSSGARAVVLFGLLVASAIACDTERTDYSAPEVRSTTVAPVTFDAVYVVNGNGPSVSVINAETNTVSGTIQLSGGVLYPHHVYLSPDHSQIAIAVPGMDMSGGHVAHVSHTGTNGLVILLDAVTGGLVKAVKTTASNHNVLFPPGNPNEVWTSEATDPGTTLILDAKTLEIRDAILVGSAPGETTFRADGQYAFVANTGSATVSVIDVPGRRVVKELPTGDGPVGAWQAPNGFAYVDNEGDHTITVIDTNKLEIARTFPLTFIPGIIAVSPTAPGEVWITDPNNERVEVRTPAGDVIRQGKARFGAHAIVFSSDGSRAYVSNQFDDSVSVLDTRTLASIATIPVGKTPNGMAWRSKAPVTN